MVESQAKARVTSIKVAVSSRLKLEGSLG